VAGPGRRLGALVVLTYLGAVNQQAPYIYFQFRRGHPKPRSSDGARSLRRRPNALSAMALALGQLDGQ
jgi:hypothetical protein